MDLEFQCDIAHIKFPPPTTGMDSCQYIKHYCSDYFKSVNFLEIYLCYTNESTLMLIVFSAIIILILFQMLWSTANKFSTPMFLQIAK